MQSTRRASRAFLFGLIGFLLLEGLGAQSTNFTFRYKAGDQYRILSEVSEEVLYNGRFSHQAYILSKISVNTLKDEEGRGLIQAQYLTSEESRLSTEVFTYSNSYTVDFWRDARGRMEVPKGAFVPTVRNVPSFPDTPLKPGDTWTMPASEVHDLRKGLGLQEPFEFPVRVTYTYVGPHVRDGREYHEIKAEYTIFQRFPRTGQRGAVPVQVSGYSEQHIFWDQALGRPSWYTEDFVIVLTLANNETRQFQGTAQARVLDPPPATQDQVLEQVQKAVDTLALENVDVRQDEEGVTISIENIQFAPDSANLLPGELAKLEQIASILAGLPGYDIAVSGHTALAGTPQGRQELSEARARAVGQFLLDRKIRTRDQIMVQGFGAEKPLADNSTEEGKRKNRRVEITILKN